jgi:hypothetical protein
MRQQLIRVLLIAGASLLAGGCASNVALTPDSVLPRPLVVPLPATGGLVIGDALRHFRHEETRGGANWSVMLGPGHERLMREVFEASFAEVREFRTLDEARGQPGVDVLLQPDIEQFSFATASDTAGGYWAATLRYRMSVYAPGGEPVDTLTLSGYGSARSGGGQAASLRRATLAAMRDAAAKFLVQFPAHPIAASLKKGEPVQASAGAGGPREDIEMVPIDPEGPVG